MQRPRFVGAAGAQTSGEIVRKLCQCLPVRPLVIAIGAEAAAVDQTQNPAANRAVPRIEPGARNVADTLGSPAAAVSEVLDISAQARVVSGSHNIATTSATSVTEKVYQSPE